MSDNFTPALAQRLGVSMQRQWQRMGYTQADLAEKSDLSLKYVGQVKRGEANVTVESLERIAVVLGWDPWTLFSIQTPPISQAVHGLLLAEVGTVQERLAITVAWLEALDPALRAPSPTAPDASGDRPVASRPRRHAAVFARYLAQGHLDRSCSLASQILLLDRLHLTRIRLVEAANGLRSLLLSLSGIRQLMMQRGVEPGARVRDRHAFHLHGVIE